jgi:2-amino-4-hydroxy-6-hydroxymethyldihydropteridine diphosphokinase
MISAYLSLGSNEGDRYQWLQKAINLLDADAGRVVSVSEIYQTAAWGMEDQADFLNMCLHMQTSMSALQLLAAIRDIETRLGRQRTVKWGPRTLDIDILFFGTQVVHTDELVIPHPHMGERRFVLKPLNDIAAELKHPVTGEAVAGMLAHCPDPLEVTSWHPNS